MNIRLSEEDPMLAYLYLIVAVAFRLVPHPAWNFTPAAAALLFFGARATRRQMWLPVVALAATDVLLNRFVYHAPTDISFLFTWLWYAAIVLLGNGILRSRTSVARVLGASLTASLSFFLISNFFVWATGTMYARNFAGLLTCFTAAIPFFRGTLAGDLVFSAAMFGLPALVHALRRSAASPRIAA